MAPVLGTDTYLSLLKQWPARGEQVRQLYTLLNPQLPNPRVLILHGPSATAKTSLIRSVLSALQTPFVHLRCAEYITVRHLLYKTIGGTAAALDLEDKDKRYVNCDNVSGLTVALQDMLHDGVKRSYGEDSMEGVVMGEGQKLVLVFDGIDRQREATGLLMPALARLGEIIPGLTVVMILSAPPKPLALHLQGVPHIEFPQYTRKEALTLMASFDAPDTDITPEQFEHIYPQFCAAVYDALLRPTSRYLPTFKSTCFKLWPLFIAPLVNKEELPRGAPGSWDFQRLVVKNRILFQSQGENMLVDRIVAPKIKSQGLPTTTATAATKDLILPFLPMLIVTAAYLAAYTPPRLDVLFFSRLASHNTLSNRNKKAHYRRRLKAIASATSTSTSKPKPDPSTPRKVGRPRKVQSEDAASSTNPMTAVSTATALTTLIPRPFPLDRLIAICRAIHPDPASLNKPQGFSSANTTKNPNPASSLSDAIYAELATLERLRLVVPAGAGGSGMGSMSGSGGTPDLSEKWRINVSDGKWIARVAKRVLDVDVGEWGVEGLFG